MEFQQIESPRARLIVADKYLERAKSCSDIYLPEASVPPELPEQCQEGFLLLPVSREPWTALATFWTGFIRVHPGDELVLHDRTGDERTVGFDEDQLVALPALSCNVIDPPFTIEVGNLRCTELR
jgi:hypothetical protein